MDIKGSQSLPLPVTEVWNGLNDPAILKASIPGCDEFNRLDETNSEIVLLATVGPIKVRFRGKIQLADVNPPTSYSLLFEGTGGPAGFAKGRIGVSLVQEGAGSVLDYSVNVNIGGKLAQVGSRLIDGVAKQTAAEFFERFAVAMDPEAVPEAAPADTATVPPAAHAAAAVVPPAARAEGKSRWVWASAVMVLVVLGAAAFAHWG